MTAATLLGACATGALQSALLVAVVAAILLLARRAKAATRHRVWFLTLVAAIAIPAIDLVADLIPAATATPVTQPVAHAMRALTAFVVPHYVVTATLAVWGLLSAFLLLRLAWSFVRIELLRRSTRAVSPELEAAVRMWASRMGIRRRVAIRSSEHLGSPIAIGFFRPLIVLPRQLLETLSETDIAYIFVHELAHLRRRDDLTNLVARIARAIFLFNPSLLIIERQMAVEREIACDDWVVATLGRARRYARCLAHVLLSSTPQAPASGVLQLFRSPEQSVARIELLLAPPAPAGMVLGNAALLAAAAVILAVMGFAASTPQIVAFDLPIVRIAQAAHLDPLRMRLFGPAVTALATAAPHLDPRALRAFEARPGRVAYGAAVAVKIPTLAQRRLELVSTVRPAGARFAQTTPAAIDAAGVRARLADEDATSAAEVVAQDAGPHASHATASHIDVGPKIAGQIRPAVAFSYNSYVLAPVTFGSGGATGSSALAVRGGGSAGGSLDGVTPPGALGAPGAAAAGRNIIPGSRRGP